MYGFDSSSVPKSQSWELVFQKAEMQLRNDSLASAAKSLFSFVIVREPLHRIISLYYDQAWDWFLLKKFPG